VHISEISHTYITDPSEKLKLNQQVTVKVTEVDKMRKRIALSIKQATPGDTSSPVKKLPSAPPPPKEKDLSGMGMADALSLLKQKFGKS
jgi:protein Tex